MHMRDEALRKPVDIEEDIRQKIIQFMSSHMLPLDIRNLEFEHLIPLPTALRMKIYIRSRVLNNGDTEIKGTLIPQDTPQKASRRSDNHIYVSAKCIIEKPRA